MNNQHNSSAPISTFDQDFGQQHFEPVEETVVIDGDIASRLLERRRPGDPEFAKMHRLFVMDPTGEEWEYPIEGEIMIGRAEDNHIALPDRAVSRHHLAVNTDGQLYWFQDLNSGNGTQVNGEYLTEGWLTGGEEILIGNTHIFFHTPEQNNPAVVMGGAAEEQFQVPPMDAPLDPMAAPGGPPLDPMAPMAPEAQGEMPMAPMEATKQKEDKGAGRLIGFLFLLVGLGVAVLASLWIYRQLDGGQKSKDPAMASDKAPADGLRPDQKALRDFERGKDAMKQGKWEEADKYLRQAASILPAADPMRGTILQYANLVHKELMAKHMFKQAKAFYNSDKISKALAMLRRVPGSSKLRSKADNLRDRIFRKELKPRMRVLRLYIDSKRINEAMKTLNEILRFAPQYQPALQIKRQLEAGDTPKAPGVRPPAAVRPKSRRLRVNLNKLPGAFSQGRTFFCAGSYAQAIIYFRQQESIASNAGLRKVAQTFLERVRTFKSNLNKGLRYARRRRYSSAISRLKKARKIDKKYFSGCQSGTYKRTLSRMYYKRSRRYYRRKRYRRVARDLNKARKLNKRSKKIYRASAAIRGRAKRLINEAKVLIGIDNKEARKYLRKAMGMLPKSDSLYRRAKSYYDRAQ